MGDAEVDDGRQHQQRSGDGIEHDLDGGRQSFGSAIDADHEEYRQQHQFPEDIKEDQVGGAYGAGHRSLGDEEIAVAAFRLVRHDEKDQGKEQWRWSAGQTG